MCRNLTRERNDSTQKICCTKRGRLESTEGRERRQKIGRTNFDHKLYASTLLPFLLLLSMNLFMLIAVTNSSNFTACNIARFYFCCSADFLTHKKLWLNSLEKRQATSLTSDRKVEKTCSRCSVSSHVESSELMLA